MWRPYYEVLANSHLEIKTRLPDLYLDSIQHLNGPNRKIQLITKGQGHTDSDLVMYLPDDRILFSGDLIFNMCHPYVPNGSISKWKDWLDFMDSLNPLTIVPGHGAIGGKDLIVTMKYYLSNLEIKAKDLHATGEKLEDIDRIRIPEEYRKWWFEPFYTLNLKFAFEEVQAVE
jgi:glyoxylase-like metal-dependent hydrolase (beta-lactamase superfamily II)